MRLNEIDDLWVAFADALETPLEPAPRPLISTCLSSAFVGLPSIVVPRKEPGLLLDENDNRLAELQGPFDFLKAEVSTKDGICQKQAEHVTVEDPLAHT